MNKVNVMVVDDSSVMRGLWSEMINAQPDMRIVTTAINGLTAIEAFNTHKPDVIILDLEMPVMDGLTALPFFIAKNSNTKVIVVSSLNPSESGPTVKALALGAADFVSRPNLQDQNPAENCTTELIHKIRHLMAGKREAIAIASNPIKAIAIGASTGGPCALVKCMRELSQELTQPIFVVQHLPATFIEPLAEKLQSCIGRRCLVATDKMIVESSTVYLAPADFYMTIESTSSGHEIRLTRRDLETDPSVDHFFESASKVFEENLLGIVLTGAGEDGRRGAQEIRSRGGRIIAQDEGSSVVWGMPGAVVKAGLADSVQSLEHLPKIINSVGRNKRI